MPSACSTLKQSSESNNTTVTHTLMRDSVYLHDSIYVTARSDTIYIERWHTRWRDRTVEKTDTLRLETTKTEVREVRYVPKFYRWCTAILAIIVLLLIARVCLKYVRRGHN